MNAYCRTRIRLRRTDSAPSLPRPAAKDRRWICACRERQCSGPSAAAAMPSGQQSTIPAHGHKGSVAHPMKKCSANAPARTPEWV